MSVGTELDPLGRLIAAIGSGDADEAREIYAPGARIWHNTEEREQSDENHDTNDCHREENPSHAY